MKNYHNFKLSNPSKNDENYYKDLILYRREIIQEVTETNKKTVARNLNLSPAKFSTVYIMLKNIRG